MPRDSPEKNTPRRLFGNSAGYSADSVVACGLPKKIQEVNEMANVKMIAPQTFQPEHMRVAAYCRVSSDSKDQLHSYAAQIRSYTEEIAQHDGWELVDVYADEGLTGTRMDKREDFNRMMRDCRKGKINRILVKSVSRFARNTKDCLSALRELSTLGVSVQFEKENIDTKTLTTELMVSVSGSLAQQESISISANQKISYQRRMERGEFITCSAPYGYRIIDKKNLEIIPEEATTVQWIFDAYLNGRSAEWIADQLTRRGIENTNTRKPWTAYGIRYILRNEKYVGDSLLGKTYTTLTLPHRKIENKGEGVQYFIEETHSPIISQEVFDKVQQLLSRKSASIPPRAGIPHPLSCKIVCGHCGAICKRKVCRGTAYWVCQTHEKSAESCLTMQTPEAEITEAFLRIYFTLKHHGDQVLTRFIQDLQTAKNGKLLWSEDIVELNKQIADIACQERLLAQLKQQGVVDPDIFISRSNQLAERRRELKLQKERILRSEEDHTIQQTQDLLDVLESGPDWLDDFDEQLFSDMVEKIVVVDNEKLCFRLLNGLEVTEKIERTQR